MNKNLIIAGLVAVIVAMLFVAPADGSVALLIVLTLSIIVVLIIRQYTDEKEYMTWLFLLALVVRLAFGVAVHYFNLRSFFGGDAVTYDIRGSLLVADWLGYGNPNDLEFQLATRTSGSGWGMNYFVGFIYFIVGRNILAAQSVCAVIGAATAPLIYFCAQKIYSNKNVSRFTAISIAVFPSFIIWSGQLMKDGLIIFLLVLAITMVLQLQDRFSLIAIMALFAALGGILALRFYIFYMVGVAVVGSFLLGTANSASSIFRRSAVLVVLGLALTYFGVTRNATQDLSQYGNLQMIQSTRLDQSQTGASGFAEDVDVSTTEGALTAIPVGFIYLMFAPFPWQMSNLRQAITLPEVLVWWALIPVMVYGMWWTVRNKLRVAFPILIFTLMLTLAYSVYQGNVGTAYRQRTQIQVFLFMFIGVGWQIYQEKKQDKKLLQRRRGGQIDRF
jgi:4-amino-4-deoxy-L-arabinose transferase-like glycosyltransferase